MSYTHIHLPELNILKKSLSENLNQIKYYAKYGAYMGPTESVTYLNQKINEYLINSKS
jgi:O-antigen/teichoic acid export membrane protein